jgi:hypothetical protein
MTVQERIDHKMIYRRFTKDENAGKWREGSVDELVDDYPFFNDYVKGINWWHNNDRIAILKKIDEDKEYHLYMFSEKHKYSIAVTPNYLGCISSSLYHLPLEDWTRGHDLPDGKCNEETLTKILFAILHDELVPFDDGSKPPVAEEEDD